MISLSRREIESQIDIPTTVKAMETVSGVSSLV